MANTENVPVLTIDIQGITSSMSDLTEMFGKVQAAYTAVDTVLDKLTGQSTAFAQDLKTASGALYTFSHRVHRLFKFSGTLSDADSFVSKLALIRDTANGLSNLGNVVSGDSFGQVTQSVQTLSKSLATVKGLSIGLDAVFYSISDSLKAMSRAAKASGVSFESILGTSSLDRYKELYESVTRVTTERAKIKNELDKANSAVISSLVSKGSKKPPEALTQVRATFKDLIDTPTQASTSISGFVNAVNNMALNNNLQKSVQSLSTVLNEIALRQNKVFAPISSAFRDFKEVNEVLTKLQDFKGEQGDAKISVKLNKTDVKKMQSIRSAAGTLAKHLQTIDGLTNLDSIATSLSDIATSFVKISKVSVSKQLSDLAKLVSDIDKVNKSTEDANRKANNSSVIGFFKNALFGDTKDPKAVLGNQMDTIAGRIGFITDPSPDNKSSSPNLSKIGFGAIMDDWQDPAKKVEDTTERLAEGSRKILDAMDMLKRALPPEFVDRIQIMNQHFVKISDTLFRLGSGFKNIAEYAEGASKVLKQLATPTHKNSLDKNLTQLNKSLKETDVSYIYKVSSALRRLGEAFANISRHGPMGTQGIALMARGGSFTADGVTTQVSPIASYIDELMKSFDTKLARRNKGTEGIFEAAFNDLAVDNAFEDSAFNQTTKMLSKLKNSLNFFRKDALAVMKTLKDPAFSKDFADGIRNFLKEIGGIFIKLPKATGQNEKNIAGISTMIHTLSSGLRGIMSLSSSASKLKGAGANLVEPITTMMEKLSALSKVPSFAGFERLADAMYKLSIGAKSVVTGVDKAERALRKYSETTSHAAKATNWFVGGWRAVVNAFTGGTVIYTIVRTIREAVDAFVEFDKKLRMINTLAGMSEKALSSLGSEIVATSGKFGLNLTQAADSMFAIQSATLRGADALRVFNASAMLSVAGGADLRNSTELITRSIMAYGKHTTEAQHIADVLFKTQDRGITTIEELAHNLTKVIPSAVAARVSFEEINAAMATLTTKGLQTTVASTALNSMLLKLTSGSEKLDAVFQKLGYDSSATALKQRGLEFVMRQISAATGGAAYELQKLGFNYRDIKAAAILANDTSGFFAETLSYINDEAEEGGKALQAYKEVSKSLGQQIAQIVATLKGAVVGISEFVAKWSGLKILLGVANWLTQVQSGLSSLAGIFKGAGGFILKFALGTGTLVASLTLLVGVLTKFKVAITGISLAKFAFKLDQVTNSSNLFMVGLKGLLGNLVTWIKTTKQASYHVDALRKAEEAYNKVKKQLGETIAKCTKEGQRYHHVALRAKRATDAWKASVVALKAAFWTLMKTTGILLLITGALEGLSWAWSKLNAAMDDKKAAKIRAEFSDMASEIDKLKTVTQVETRIEALSAQLEKLSTMSPTANVKALMKEYQTAIEKLNQKKMDMTNIQNAGESFEKLEEARKKLLMLDVNKMQQVNILKEENYELSKQLAMLPKASSAWAKMATKITNNTIKIKQLTDELRGMYDFVPNSLYSDVDNLYGDSLKGTSAKLKLKEDEIKTLLQQQGWSPQMISMALSQSALTAADFRKMQGSMQGAYQVRDSLVSRVQGALGRGMSKVTPGSYLNQVSSDLKNLGMSDLGGFDKQHLLKNIPEIVNILGKLNTDLVNFNQANLTGVDRTNEALSLSVKRLSAIVQIRERLVEGNKNATKEQREALEAAKKELQQAQELLKTKQMLVDPYMNTATSDWTRGQKKALLDLYNQDSSFKKVIDDSGLALEIKRYLSGAFDAKNMGTFVKDALKKWYTLLVPTGKVKTLKTTQADSKLIGSYQKASSANETVLRLFKEWHELQLKSNKQYAEAYRKLYASSYDVYNSLRNASFGNLAGKIGSVNRDPMDLLREKILSPTGATSDAVAAAGNTLKQFGVFDGKNLDVSNVNFREAVAQALVSATSAGGKDGLKAAQLWLAAMQNLQGKLQELGDPYSKNRRKYIDAMGTPSEKLSLLKSDASRLNKLYTTELAKKMPDAGLLENLQNAIWDNAVQQKQILASIPAGKPVPVSEQVSLASKEAYHLLQAQTTSNEGQKRMYTHVGDINANFKRFVKKFDRDSRAVYTAQKQEAVNMVVAVTP